MERQRLAVRHRRTHAVAHRSAGNRKRQTGCDPSSGIVREREPMINIGFKELAMTLTHDQAAGDVLSFGRMP
jgi:hypothetical protein